MVSPRVLLSTVVLITAVFPAVAQDTSSNTAIVHGGEIKDKASTFGDAKYHLSKGDTVLVLREKESYTKVQHDGETGWLSKRQIMNPQEANEYLRTARERKQYLQGLRKKGYTIILTRQTFGKNSADGISVGLGLVNISRSKTIKYLEITWKLFNSVGDPTMGNNTGSTTAQTRLVGPVEPEETGYTAFENAWYSSVGTCAEIRKIEVEHIDGSSFTYINDLEDIAREAERVRLKGDCSYEAQQKRN